MFGKAISHYRIAEQVRGFDMGMVRVVEDTRVDWHITPTCLPDTLVADSQAIERCRHEAHARMYEEAYG
jgi:hypothetical protein